MLNKKRRINLTKKDFDKKLKFVKEFCEIKYNEEPKIGIGSKAYIIDKISKIELTFKDPTIGCKIVTYIFDKACSANIHQKMGVDAWATLQKYYKIPHIGDKEESKKYFSNTITGKLYSSPYFEGERYYAYGYDMNSAFSWGMLQDMPKDTEKGPINLDKDKQPIPRTLKNDEIGFDIVGNIKYSGELATYIFKKMSTPFARFVNTWYNRKRNAKTIEEKTAAKDMLVMCVGFMQRHNFWMRAAIIGHCNRRINKLINKYDYCILLSNTDSIVSTERIPEIEENIGREIGQWKLEHEGYFAYKGMNYQWDDKSPTYRGVCKSWFNKDFDILKDKAPTKNNFFNFDKEKVKLVKTR